MSKAKALDNTRRSFLVGASAAIAAGTIAGTAIATDTVAFQEAVNRPAAIGIIDAYGDYDVQFVPQPDGSFRMCSFIGEGTRYDHAAVTKLDKYVNEIPGLREAIRDRLREAYSIQS